MLYLTSKNNICCFDYMTKILPNEQVLQTTSTTIFDNMKAKLKIV